jgi:hypothetical protein
MGDAAKTMKYCGGSLDDLRAFRILYVVKFAGTV